MVEPSVPALQAALAEVAMTDDLWATVIGERPHVGHPGVPVQDDDEALMTVVRPGDAAGPDGVSLEADGRRAFARISVDGEHAAEGQVGLADGYAVFDRIRTQDAFQRRGLGSRIMQALTAWSVDQGATTGVLVASAQGQLLYGRLGWTRRAPLTTWARSSRTW
jgi:GNAT superfamily N-acetyltransferase